MGSLRTIEARLRRRAARRALLLVKSRRRDPGALDYQHYWLVSWEAQQVVLGGDWGTTLDLVAEALDGAAAGQSSRRSSGSGS